MNEELSTSREELLNSIREKSRENKDALHSRFYPHGPKEGEENHSPVKGTFALRFLICLFLFIGFYYMHQSKTSVFKMDSVKIMDEVTKGLDADTVMKQITGLIKEKP